MIPFVRNSIYFVVLVLTVYIGWQCFVYGFDKTCPEVTVMGLEDGGYYKGDITCVVHGHDRYKVAHISVWLDGHPLVERVNIGATSFERPLDIPTRTLSQGAHNLKIEVIDGTYRSNKTILERTFFVDNAPLQGAFVRPESDFKVLQGRTLRIPVQFNKPVKSVAVKALLGSFSGVPESDGSTIYECFIPIGCEEKEGECACELIAEDFVGNVLTLQATLRVVAYSFKRQVLRGINTDRFEEEKKLGKSEKELHTLLADLVRTSPNQKLWRGVFYKPLNVTAIMCDFGAKRITQERGCYIHAAIDMVGLLKTVVWATQDGIVAVKDRFEVTGNTVVIDHGCGVVTLLCHLDTFADISVGDRIKRGNPVGIMGKTGYATGDHLHWEMRVNNIPVDPMQWTKQDF
jgi:hypothetical protein